MFHKITIRGLVILALLNMLTIGKSQAADPVTIYLATYAGEYLAGKALDQLFDPSSGKPNISLIDARLKELEGNVAMRGEMQNEIEKLRRRINNNVTKNEFMQLTEQVISNVQTINKRLDDLEIRVERLEVDNEDLRRGTRNSTNANYYCDRAEIFTGQKNNVRAMANYNLALKSDEKLERAIIGRIKLYESIGCNQIAACSASDALQKSLSKTTRTWILTEKAYIEFEGNDFQKAILDCSILVSENPNRAEVYRLRAKAHLNLENIKESISDFGQAIKYDGQVWQDYFNRSIAYGILDDYAHLRRIKVPANYHKNKNLAESYRETAYDLEIKDLDKALELSPDNIQILSLRGENKLNRATMDSVSNKFKSNKSLYLNAVPDLEQLVKLDPKNRKYLMDLAYAYRNGGFEEKAKLIENELK